MEYILFLQNVTFAYRNIFTLNKCNVGLKKGACTFMLGPNGAGKTTVMKLMAGLLKPTAGNVLFDGHDLFDLSRRQIAEHIALVEQDSAYLYPFTVEEVVLMGRFSHSGHAPFEHAEDIDKTTWAMNVTNTTQFRNRSILSLSGGERRRVEIARALAQEADVLLLDEPTSHLDIKQQRELFRLLHQLHTHEGKTLFIISHHLKFITEYADQLLFIKDGVIREGMDKSELEEERLIEMF